MPRRTHPDPDWFAWVQPGDVLRKGNNFRVVRLVTRYPHTSWICVLFVIQRCSWTRRPDTCYSSADLKYQRWQHTGVRVKLTDDFSQRFEFYLQNYLDGRRYMTCKTAVGFP